MLPKVHLIGNVSQKPVIGFTNSGIKYAKINVACSPVYNKNNPKTITNYFSMTVWRFQADFVENKIDKGDGVYIDGNLATRTYTNNEGRVVYTTEIQVQNIWLTNHRSARQNSFNQQPNFAYLKNEQVNNYQTNQNTSFNVPIDENQIVTSTQTKFNQDEDENFLSNNEFELNIADDEKDENSNDSQIYDSLWSK